MKTPFFLSFLVKVLSFAEKTSSFFVHFRRAVNNLYQTLFSLSKHHFFCSFLVKVLSFAEETSSFFVHFRRVIISRYQTLFSLSKHHLFLFLSREVLSFAEETSSLFVHFRRAIISRYQISRQGIADAEITIPSAENSDQSKVLSFQSGVGRNIAMHALPTARNFFLMSALSVHSTSFVPNLSPLFRRVRCWLRLIPV